MSFFDGKQDAGTYRPHQKKLGRLFAEDPRDAAFPLPRAAVAPPERTYRYWSPGWRGNQGSDPHCVAFTFAHLLECSPIRYPASGPEVGTAWLYREAQANDEWPGSDYDGTSARGAAKVLQGHGYIESYTWGFSAEEIARAVINKGPVAIGTNWYDSMWEPDAKGFLTISPTAVWEGGHETLVDGASLTGEKLRIMNSWGLDWGDNGRAWMTFETLDRLLREDGDACLVIEKRPA